MLVQGTVTVTTSGLGAAVAIVALRARMRASHCGLENMVDEGVGGSGGWIVVGKGDYRNFNGSGNVGCREERNESLMVLRKGFSGDVDKVSKTGVVERS